MKTIIIHIGLMKTGSTTLQNLFFENYRHLLKMGVNYPPELHHHNLKFTPLFREEPWMHPDWKKIYSKEEALNEINQLDIKWKKALAENNSRYFIISSEWLSHFETLAIKKLKNYILPYFDEIKILLYVRHPSEYIPSIIQQDIKNGFSDDSIEQLFNKAIEELSYSGIINKWDTVMGKENLKVIPYDKKYFYKGDLVKDFFVNSGIGEIDRSLLMVTNLNVAIGTNSSIVLHTLNQKFPRFIKGKLNKDRGLYSRVIPENVYRYVETEKLKLPLVYSQAQIEHLNNEITFINSYFSIKCQYAQIKPEVKLQTSHSFKLEKVPLTFYIELINEYHKEINMHLDLIDNIKAKLEKQNSLIVRQKEDIVSFEQQISNCEDSISSLKSIMADLYLQKSYKPIIKLKNIIKYFLYRNRFSFDHNFYARQNPEVVGKRKSLLLHFMLHGNYELRKPNPDFDIEAYLHKNPELIKTGELAPLHYYQRCINKEV